MDNNAIPEIIRILKEEYKRFREPVVSLMANQGQDPFKILIATVLSLRTKDDVTKSACERLFAVADRPETMMRLAVSRIEKLIYPVGFYKVKSNNIINICNVLVSRYGGRVPDTIDELLTFKGVGRKTANLVITLGYGKPGVCVDTHVHRISNRFGYVRTSTPKKTEFALREKLDKKYWIIYNDLLVCYGQNVCKPVSPLCSQCRISHYCDRIGVKNHR